MMTAAEWKAAIALALAAREKLRRAHNAMGATVVDANGAIRPDRKAAWDRYRSEQFLPASRRIEERICTLRDDVPDAVKAEARAIVKAGKLVLPAGATWAERMALLEAAAFVFGERDPESKIVVPANSLEAIAPPQEALGAADITPTGGRAELPPDPTEDYTTYTELDPNNRYAVTASTITVTDIQRDEDAYIYKDRGAGHFDGFSHNVDFKSTAVSSDSYFAFWALANTVDDMLAWANANAEAVQAGAYSDSPTAYLRNNETGALSGTALANNTQYYITFSRAIGGTTLTMYVYSDASRTTLIASPSVSVSGARTYRYNFAVNSYNSGTAYPASAIIANLDIGEAMWTPRSGEVRGLWAFAAPHEGEARGLWSFVAPRSGETRGRWQLFAARSGEARGFWSFVAPRSGETRGRWSFVAPRSAEARSLWSFVAPRTGEARGLWQLFAARLAEARGLWQLYQAREGEARGLWAFVAPRSAEARSVWRIAADSLEGWLVYRGTGGASPDFSASPWAFAAALPADLGALAPGDTYLLVARCRNRFGLVSQNVAPEVVFEIDVGGGLVGARPSAPYAQTSAAAAAGAIRVEAWYNRLPDGANAADQWLIYQTSNGVNPDPAVDVPAVVAMSGGAIARLDRTAGTFAHGATIKTLVRTRLAGTPNLDSTNLSPSTATASTAVPATPAAEIFQGYLWKQGQS